MYASENYTALPSCTKDITEYRDNFLRSFRKERNQKVFTKRREKFLSKASSNDQNNVLGSNLSQECMTFEDVLMKAIQYYKSNMFVQCQEHLQKLVPTDPNEGA